MGDLDDLVTRLTSRLSGDREVQLEVAAQLRRDLQVPAISPASESELADQLWQTHRARIGKRKLARWILGITLPLAVMAAIIAIARTVAVWGTLLSVAMQTDGPVARWTGKYSQPSTLPQIVRSYFPHRERFIFDVPGPPMEVCLQEAKALADRHPDDPLYWANYAMYALSQYWGESGYSRAKLSQTVTILDRGKQIEPDNAFYPAIKSALLLRASTNCVLANYDKDTPVWEYVDRSNMRKYRVLFDRYQVLDAAAFAKGLVELHEAADKPYLNARCMDLVVKRLSLLPPPPRLIDVLLRTDSGPPVEYCHMYWDAIEIAGNHAVEAAAHGQGDQLMHLVRDARRLSLLLVDGAQLHGEVLHVSRRYRHTLFQEAAIYRQMGRTADFERTWARHQELDQEITKAISSLCEKQRLGVDTLVRQAAFLDLVCRPAIDPTKVNFIATRNAEYTLIDQGALSVMLAMLCLAVLGSPIAAMIQRRRTGRSAAILWIGWKRLFKVVGLATMVPVVAHLLYAYLTPLGGRSLGTLISIPVMGDEYALLFGVVCVLLGAGIATAIRKRASEIGLEPLGEGPGSKRLVCFGAFLGLIALGHIVWWRWWGSQRGSFCWVAASLVSVVLVGALVAYGIIWLSATPRPSRQKRSPLEQAGFSYELSAAPVILFAALALALIAGPALRSQEQRAVAAVHAEECTFVCDQSSNQGCSPAIRQRLQEEGMAGL